MYRSKIFLLTIGFSVFLSLFAHVKLREYAYDDAYIHFRVANNFIETGKPYFNEGENINVSSSIGWTILLSILVSLTRVFSLALDLPLLVSIFNGLTLCASAVIYTLLLYQISQHKGLVYFYISFYWIYFALCLQVSLSLMETVTGLFIIGLSFHFLLAHQKIALTLFGLAISFRLEFVIPVGMTLLFILFLKQFSIQDTLIYFGIGFLPFLIFELYFFGKIIPHSLLAKSTIYNLSPTGTFIELFSVIQTDLYFLTLRNNVLSKLALFYIFYLPSILLAIYFLQLTKSLKKYQKNDYQWIVIIFFIWGILLLFLYLLSGTKIFAWYIPVFTVPLLITCGYVILTQSSKAIYRAILIFSTPMLIIQILVIVHVTYGTLVNPAYISGFSEGARTKQYIEIGTNLYSQYPGATLLTSEIGGLGYGFKGKIIDSAGIASPEALDFYKTESRLGKEISSFGAIKADFVAQKKPELIVSYDFFIEDLLNNENILLNYKVIKYSVFLEEDREISRIKLLSGDEYYRSLWYADELLILLRNDILQ